MSTLAVPTRPRRITRVSESVAPGRLRPPPLHAGVVERPRLVERLEKLARGPLVVVAAPTGYGKTALLASWVASTSRRVAWASVGSHDLGLDGFWTLAAAAIERVEPERRFALRAGRAASDRALQMATALGSLSHELTLVLDGYEQASRGGIDSAFGRFLDLAPETLHVVVSTRCEPDLALPLRRARGTVAELTADDLRLDVDETAAALRRVSDGKTAGKDVAAFAERTEGWPAAVYLAGLAMRRAAHPAETLAHFSGATTDLSDYLRLELLDAQPDDLLRSFLLETSVFDSLTAPLCDALLGRHDSETTLRTLRRAGAFLVPHEPAAHAYRYVRPVGEFLRAEFARVAPERVADLHLRAAAACERAGLIEEAAAHSRAAAGEDEAGRLLSRHALELVRDGRNEHLELLLATRTGAAAARRLPALRSELRRLAAAGSNAPALGRAAERVAALGAGLPSGTVRALVESTAQAARAYALLLSGSLAEAYEAGASAYATADRDAGASAGQAAAVASLAAARLGLGAAAGPLARAGASALARQGVDSGTAAALVELAEAAVAEKQDDCSTAERLSARAAERAGEPTARALALLQLSRLQKAAPEAARETFEQANVELARCEGTELLESLAAEVKTDFGGWKPAPPARGDLSDAEQRVLRLLATRLTQREIASELYISLNTVKTHVRLIYRKLGVSSRASAVAAGHELNLV